MSPAGLSPRVPPHRHFYAQPSPQPILKNGILPATALAADLRLGRGYLVQLQQVMVNLIVNAVEAMAMKSEGPRELLVASQNEGQDQIVIQVRDSGIGIDPGLLQQIFQPFVTSKPDGLGFELSLIRPTP